MAGSEDIAYVISRLKDLSSAGILRTISETTVGEAAVLQYLSESPSEASAGRIARHLGVSTARVAALLNKMEQRGWVSRRPGKADGRVVLVGITREGRLELSRLQQGLYHRIGSLIDQIGMEKLREFLDTADQISALTSPGPQETSPLSNISQRK